MSLISEVPMKLRPLSSNVKVKISFLRKSSLLWPYLLNMTIRVNLRIFKGTFGLRFYTTEILINFEWSDVFETTAADQGLLRAGRVNFKQLNSTWQILKLTFRKWRKLSRICNNSFLEFNLLVPMTHNWRWLMSKKVVYFTILNP